MGRKQLCESVRSTYPCKHSSFSFVNLQRSCMSVYPLGLVGYKQFGSKFRAPNLLRQHLYTSKMHSFRAKTHFFSSFKCDITLLHGLFPMPLFMLLITDVTNNHSIAGWQMDRPSPLCAGGPGVKSVQESSLYSSIISQLSESCPSSHRNTVGLINSLLYQHQRQLSLSLPPLSYCLTITLSAPSPEFWGSFRALALIRSLGLFFASLISFPFSHFYLNLFWPLIRWLRFSSDVIFICQYPCFICV